MDRQRFVVGFGESISDEKTNKTKQNILSLKWEKKGTIQAYFHLSIQSSLVCNGKMNLKSDIRIKILNDIGLSKNT